jgi:hypothetical protein
VTRGRCGLADNRNLGAGLTLGIVLNLMMHNLGSGIAIGVAVVIATGAGLNEREGGRT